MLRNLALITMFAGGLVAAGCRDDGGNNFTPADFSRVEDMKAGGGGDGGGGGNDLSVQKMYTQMTPNAIDTGPGTLANTAVKLTGVVVTTPLNAFVSKSTTCKYDLTVQEPSCTTPPCGIVVEETGMTMTGVMTKDCINAKDNTMLGKLMIGDVVDVAGIVDIFPDSMNSMIKQHSVQIDSATKTGGPMTITPMVISDTTAIGGFVTHTTGLWPMYEGTLITLAPTAGKLTVSAIDTATPYHFHTTPGNADWATTFRFVYNAGADGAVFPMQNSQWTSITGVVYTIFGGAIAPRFMNDFKP